MKKLLVVAVMFGLLFGIYGSANATNGYFSHGYGIKAKGMGGASTAMSSDTFGGATNPAKMVWVGDRLDIGVELFSPIRSSSRQDGTFAGGIYNDSVESDTNYFLVPEFGYNKMLNPNLSLGISVYGNGGMNTDYNDNNGLAGTNFNPALCGTASANLLFGCDKLGVDLMQLIIAPTLAYKVSEKHSFGISPLIGYQRFKVDGLQAFTGISSNPNDVTNKGYDDATGFGVRIGWMGKISDTVTLGAAYSSKVYMSKFDKYKGLFAEQGDFDIPENYNFGIAIKASPVVSLALDVQRINYSGVKSIANGVTNSLIAPPSDLLGSDNGSAFKWRDQTVYKVGIEYDYNKDLTLRCGYNYGKSPIRDGLYDVTFNILAPGVVEHHITLGSTYKVSTRGELTVSYMHGFSGSVTGPSAASLLVPGGGMGNETLKMSQNSFAIAYGIKF